MHHFTTLALASAASLVAASPLTRREIVQFPSGTSWDIILENSGVTLDQMKAATGSVIDIDLFDNTKDGKTTIKDLVAAKKTVICYFSAGSREDWRDDAKNFNWPDDYGKNMTWKGENWVNVKSTNVRAIMKKRIEDAAKAGCHAIDPDNVDGFDGNQDGYNYDKSAYAEYVNYLAGIAKDHNLAIGLKNALDIIPDVLANVQFAVNEQCHEQDECPRYKPFTEKNKAVFQIEYGGNNCTEPAGVDLSEVIKPDDQALNTLGGQCA